jgi:hypothetical protein
VPTLSYIGIGNSPVWLVPPSAASSVSIMEDWIEECQKSHSKCRLERKPRLPTSVLDVSAGKESVIYLNESANLKTKYFTLSYRWGAPKLLITTKATL